MMMRGVGEGATSCMLSLLAPLYQLIIQACRTVKIQPAGGGMLKRKSTKRVVNDEDEKNDDVLCWLWNNKLDPVTVAAPVATD